MAGLLEHSISLPTRPWRQYRTTTANSIRDNGSTGMIAMSEGREGDEIYWHIVTFSLSDNFTTTSGADLELVFSGNLY